MTELRVLKLLNGDDIIGIVEDIKDVSGEEYNESDFLPVMFIRGAMKINKTYDKRKKQYDLYLTDWIPESHEDLFPIPKSMLVTVSAPAPEIEQYYFNCLLANLSQQQLEEAQQEELSEEELKKMRQRKELLDTKFSDDDIQ